MVFGLEGSKLLVKVANTLINPIGKDGKAQSTFSKKSIPNIDIGNIVKDVGEGLLNTAQNSFSMNGLSLIHI